MSAQATCRPRVSAKARAAEAALALRVGDDTGAWASWREACDADAHLCAPLGHANRLGASESLASLSSIHFPRKFSLSPFRNGVHGGYSTSLVAVSRARNLVI